MRGEPTVVDYLNKALRHELTAVNQYWLHYRLLDNWGYKALAKRWRKESIEEMQHADKIIERIIFLDGFPNMQTLEALHIGQTVKQVVDRDLQAEMDARALYEEAATHCHSVKDYVTRDLFEELMHDEEEHIDFLETQLDLIGRLGLELCLAYARLRNVITLAGLTPRSEAMPSVFILQTPLQSYCKISVAKAGAIILLRRLTRPAVPHCSRNGGGVRRTAPPRDSCIPQVTRVLLDRICSIH